MPWQRPDDRQPDQLRPVSFQVDFTSFATSSILACCGNTRVLCTVTVEPGVPKFLQDSGRGWLTAEYRMLPGATPQRQRRELMKLSGRTQEIQRLIGRSLRSCLDFTALEERTIIVDADVLQADAGTRTTAITGGYVALADAVLKLLEAGELERSPLVNSVAAVSVGLLEGEPFLDLQYQEDVAAEVDFNVVMDGSLRLVELQGTAESKSFDRPTLDRILDLAEKGIRELSSAQHRALRQ